MQYWGLEISTHPTGDLKSLDIQVNNSPAACIYNLKHVS